MTALVPRLRSAPWRGQAMIELALVLPVLLLIVMGAIDVGRVFFDYVGLRNAAIEGAIYGSRHPEATSAIEQRVRDHFLPGTLPAGTTIAVAADAACTGADSLGQTGFVAVTVTREFRPITLDLLQFAGPGTDWTFTVRPIAKARCMT